MIDRLSVISGFIILLLSGCNSGISDVMQPRRAHDIASIATSMGFQLHPIPSMERSFLTFVQEHNELLGLRSVAILRNDDRVATVYWLSSPDAPSFFHEVTARAVLKFSDHLSHLVDERIHRPDHVPIDMFAFTDPVIGEERFVFALVENTLYEFHVSEDNESWVHRLLFDLTAPKEATK